MTVEQQFDRGRLTRSSTIVTLGVFLAIILAGGVLSAAIADDDSSAVAAAGEPTVVFDGSACSYTGPDTLPVATTAFIVRNETPDLGNGDTRMATAMRSTDRRV